MLKAFYCLGIDISKWQPAVGEKTVNQSLQKQNPASEPAEEGR